MLLHQTDKTKALLLTLFVFDFVSSHLNHFELNLFCVNFAQIADDWDGLDGMLNVDIQLVGVVYSAVAVDIHIHLYCLALHKQAKIDRPLFEGSCKIKINFC